MPVERSGSSKPKCHLVTRAGAYFPLLVVFCSVLLVGSLSRCLLVLWQFDRVSESGVFPSIFLHGLRVDLILAGMAVAPMLLVLPILGNRFNWALWKKLTFSWAILVIALIIFMELVTPAFINQYDVRPNRLFIEYLKYPREVFSMLWTGYKSTVFLSLGLTVAGVAVFEHRHVEAVGVDEL